MPPARARPCPRPHPLLANTNKEPSFPTIETFTIMKIQLLMLNKYYAVIYAATKYVEQAFYDDKTCRNLYVLV